MNTTNRQLNLSRYAIQLGLLLATVIGGSIGTSPVALASNPAPTANTSTSMNNRITVAINKAGANDTVEDGKTYTYTLTPKITASKCGTARKVTIVETLPAFLTYQPGSSKIAPQVTKNHDGTTTLTWNLGDPMNNDANHYWPANYIQGGGIATQNDPLQHNKVKPGDELEYTVYFLNAGNGSAKKVRVCDLLTANQTYVPGVSLAIGSGANKMTGSSSQIQYIPAGGAIPSSFGIKNANNINGLVVIDVNCNNFPTLPGAAVQPELAYGAISFRTKVN
jgi:uncharacterized repeat protein (TIGR01451 family)/fimbrial isopeptide formation D2 family protein